MSLKPPPTGLNPPSPPDRAFRVGSALSGREAEKGGLRSGFRRLATRVFSTLTTRCPSCAHRNSADSRFCSACGGTLHLPPHLASCPRCGVVGQVTATVCFWCHGPLLGRRAGSGVVSSPASRAFRVLLRRPSLAIAGAAALGAVVVLGYANYRQPSPIEAPRPSAASNESSDRGAPVESPPAQTPVAKTPAPAVARTQAPSAGRAGEKKAPRPDACRSEERRVGKECRSRWS